MIPEFRPTCYELPPPHLIGKKHIFFFCCFFVIAISCAQVVKAVINGLVLPVFAWLEMNAPILNEMVVLKKSSFLDSFGQILF
jgi:hypothetical protein